jgi:hypothetical protein
MSVLDVAIRTLRVIESVGSLVFAVTVTGFVPSPTTRSSTVERLPARTVYVGLPAPCGASSRRWYASGRTFIAVVVAYRNVLVCVDNVPETVIGVPLERSTHREFDASRSVFAVTVRTPLVVIVEDPVFVVVATATPSPNVRLLKLQSVLPAKFVLPCTVIVPPVIAIVPFPVTPPVCTVTSAVPEIVPAVIVRAFVMVYVPDILHPPPVPLAVSEPKVIAGIAVMSLPVVVPFITQADPLPENIDPLSACQEPPKVCVSLPAPAKVAPLSKWNFPS